MTSHNPHPISSRSRRSPHPFANPNQPLPTVTNRYQPLPTVTNLRAIHNIRHPPHATSGALPTVIRLEQRHRPHSLEDPSAKRHHNWCRLFVLRPRQVPSPAEPDLLLRSDNVDACVPCSGRSEARLSRHRLRTPPAPRLCSRGSLPPPCPSTHPRLCLCPLKPPHPPPHPCRGLHARVRHGH